MRFGKSLSNECFKNTVIKTQLLIPVFAAQAEATRDCLWWFFSEPAIFIWGKRDVFVYLLCFLVVRSMLMFVYLILNGFSVYLSSSGISQGLQMSRLFFPSMPTHLCMCLSSICVLTHTFMSAEDYKYIFTRQCHWAVLQEQAQNWHFLCQWQDQPET